MRYLSVCSGIEAASVAWHPLGWTPVAFSEVEPFACAVLKHHYPSVPNWGDMTNFAEWPDATIDVLVGGTPCQSFSVAGLRKGMADPRGNLALTYLAIADRYRPEWVVWENVPGVLSSNGGRDFGALLGGLGQLGYGFAYRVLDAQFVRVGGFPRAVPQRRRRVFVVGCLGGWQRAAAVLFERESLCGDPPPRREPRQRAAEPAAGGPGSGGLFADVAPALVSSGRGVERPGETRGQDPMIAVEVAGTLQHSGKAAGSATQRDVESGMLVAFGGNDTRGPIEVATACRAKGGTGHGDFESETFVAHSLRAEGFDASEDGTGRGTPLVPVVMPILEAGARTGTSTTDPRAGIGIGEDGDPMFTLQAGKQHAIAFDTTQITHPENRSQPQPGGPCHTLPKEGHAPAIAFAFEPRTRGDDGRGYERAPNVMDNVAPSINTVKEPVAAFNLFPSSGQGATLEASSTEISNAVSAVQNGAMTDRGTRVVAGWAVRRLTPAECESLQGFPEKYTACGYRGKPAADGPRYRALGNSMAVNCMRWIGERIGAVASLPSHISEAAE